MKKKLVISFSGGRTSAYMLWWLLNEWGKRHEYEILVVFANTGKEVEGTLFFVDECTQEWNIPIVWVEGYPSEKGKGWAVNHKIVTYETASRNGEPFEAMIARLGIPSTNSPFCSDQLKKAAIESFLKSIGWKDAIIAIGKRIDEPKRLKKRRNNVILPFADIKPTTKIEVMEWWQKQSFDLNIHPDEGNCDNCWKKDFPRLVRNMIRKPDSYKWWEEMQIKYADFDPRDISGRKGILPPYNFFRGNKSTFDIREMAKMSQVELKQLELYDNPCGESCEAF